MNAASGRWRRWAVKLVQHAAGVLPRTPSPWADAMQRELAYIEDDPAAVRWALGCVLASYKVRLTHWPRGSSAVVWRHVATGGALMLMIGLALQDHAGGQTAPPRLAVDEAACNSPDVSTELGSGTAVGVRRNDDSPGAGDPRSDCNDPSPAKDADTPSSR